MPIPQSTSCAPPEGYVYLGVDVDSGSNTGTAAQALARWNAWKALTESTPAISFSDSYSVGWLPFYLQNVAAPRNAISYLWWRPITYSMTQRKIVPISLKGMAEGTNLGGFSTDRMILETSLLCAVLNQPMLISPAPDVNDHNVPWCPFDENGIRREHTPEDYINMFRRMVILTKGGTVAQIDARLAEYNLNPLDKTFTSTIVASPVAPGAAYINAHKVNFVFSVKSAPAFPLIAENHWSEYYPGDEFVDWAGQSVYNTDPRIFDDLNRFYDEYSKKREKPSIITNWKMDKDDAFFLDSMMHWAINNNRVHALVFSNTPVPMKNLPNSLKRFKAKANDSRFLSYVYTNQDLDPWVHICSPSAGEIVNGIVGILIESNDDGSVIRADFSVDGQHRFTDRINPTTFWWDTREETNGFHEVGVKVYDENGEESSTFKTTYRVSN